MRMFILGMMISVLCINTTNAQVQQFPYEAVVQSNNLDLRSGPGRKYYPTNQLAKGDRVTVHRHDPGGWYMVAPLSNSFSWIEADKVQTDDGTNGVVAFNQSSVRVGSHANGSRDVEQVRLSKGDSVQILDQAIVSTTDGKKKLYKIVSPQREYRWVVGQFVTPASQKVKQQQDTDPFSIPSSVERPTTVPVVQTVSGFRSRRSYEADSRVQGFKVVSKQRVNSRPSQDALSRQRKYLQSIDQQLRSMLQDDPSEWELTKFRKEYQTLSKLSVHRTIRSRADQRLETLKKYQHMKDEYDRYMNVMNQTDKKDKELTTQLEAQIKSMTLPQGASLSNSDGTFEMPGENSSGPKFSESLPPIPTDGDQFFNQPLPAAGSNAKPVVTPPRLLSPSAYQQPQLYHQQQLTRKPTPIHEQQQVIHQKRTVQVPTPIQQQSAKVSGPELGSPVQHTNLNPIKSSTPVPQPKLLPLPQQTNRPKPIQRQRVPHQRRTTARKLPKFTTAGIVQRTNGRNRQTARYVLVQPNGRLIAHLHATKNVQLEQYLGKSVGLFGKRYHRPDLGADLLIVDKLTPVRLVQR